MPTSLGPAEILVILVVALIVLGPKRLPEAGRQVGKAIAEVRRWTNDVTSEIKSAVDVDVPLKSTPMNSNVVEPVVVSATATAVETTPVPPVTEVAEPSVVTAGSTAVDVPAERELSEPAVDAVTTEPPESPPGDPARL